MGNYDYLVKERNTTLNESDTELYNLRTGEKVKSLSELKKQYNGLLQTKKNNFKNELNQKKL